MTHFHKSTNYGGVLQAYALCEYLNRRGHQARQILYTHTATKVSAAPVTAKELLDKAAGRLRKKLYSRLNRQIKNRMESLFREFRDRVPHTSCEYTKDSIGSIARDFDAFVTGSDQVFNPIWYDPAYLLDFVGQDIPRVAYAASLGVGSLDDAQAQIFRTHLPAFRGVSVREKTGSQLLTPLLGETVPVCVDPTLLLSAEDWDEIAPSRKIQEPYVFLYLLGEDVKTRKLAEAFARTRGLKLVLIPDLMGAYRKKDWKLRGERLLDITPGDFVSLIKHADYVLTDSFHACVFSLLYHREFFAFPRTGTVKTGSRIADLLEMFGCSQRFCCQKEQQTLSALLSCEPLDYSADSSAFSRELSRSVEFLEDHLR